MGEPAGNHRLHPDPHWGGARLLPLTNGPVKRGPGPTWAGGASWEVQRRVTSPPITRAALRRGVVSQSSTVEQTAIGRAPRPGRPAPSATSAAVCRGPPCGRPRSSRRPASGRREARRPSARAGSGPAAAVVARRPVRRADPGGQGSTTPAPPRRAATLTAAAVGGSLGRRWWCAAGWPLRAGDLDR
jgi:hypothetical protein